MDGFKFNGHLKILLNFVSRYQSPKSWSNSSVNSKLFPKQENNNLNRLSLFSPWKVSNFFLENPIKSSFHFRNNFFYNLKTKNKIYFYKKSMFISNEHLQKYKRDSTAAHRHVWKHREKIDTQFSLFVFYFFRFVKSLYHMNKYSVPEKHLVLGIDRKRKTNFVVTVKLIEVSSQINIWLMSMKRHASFACRKKLSNKNRKKSPTIFFLC